MNPDLATAGVWDPMYVKQMLWPHVTFYREQQEIIYSVMDNKETIVPAGNMLGKDFVSAFVVLWFFITRSPCRIITTSADSYQLEDVLWGEIRNFIATAAQPLDSERGGPLTVNHLHIRKSVQKRARNGAVKWQECGLSYIRGRVAAKGEGLLGHHVANLGDGIPRTLYMVDEASGVEDQAITNGLTWANRMLMIGNPYPCQNYFRRAVKEGDLLAPGGDKT